MPLIEILALSDFGRQVSIRIERGQPCRRISVGAPFVIYVRTGDDGMSGGLVTGVAGWISISRLPVIMVVAGSLLMMVKTFLQQNEARHSGPGR